jgi:hypothetical protein
MRPGRKNTDQKKELRDRGQFQIEFTGRIQDAASSKLFPVIAVSVVVVLSE